MKKFRLAFADLVLLWATILLVLAIGSPPTALADTLTYQPGPSQGKDVRVEGKVVNGSNVFTAEDDMLLQVGTDPALLHGFLIDFDLKGLPKVASKVILSIVCVQTDESVPTTEYYIYSIADAWNEQSLTAMPKVYSPPTTAPAPTPWYWINFDITNIYNSRQAGTSSSKGLLFWAKTWNNQMNQFISSDYSDATYRPKLTVTFTPTITPPSLKMPLPGGKSWMVTTEIGSGDCASPNSTPLPSHSGINHFSIDLAPRTTGNVPQSNVSVLAAAGGKIVTNTYSSDNGNYVVINHSGYSNETQGYTTRYLHLASKSSLVVGSTVSQGQKIGVMGKTGTDAVHLHFGVRYNNSGASNVNQLSWVKMEGLPLKQYQTECSGSTRTMYYPSTNTTN